MTNKIKCKGEEAVSWHIVVMIFSTYKQSAQFRL